MPSAAAAFRFTASTFSEGHRDDEQMRFGRPRVCRPRKFSTDDGSQNIRCVGLHISECIADALLFLQLVSALVLLSFVLCHTRENLLGC